MWQVIIAAAILASSVASSGAVLGPYYVFGAIAAILACVVTARQLLKKLRERWIGEDNRDKTLEANTTAVKDFGDKLENISTKLIDHDNRLVWVELQVGRRPSHQHQEDSDAT